MLNLPGRLVATTPRFAVAAAALAAPAACSPPLCPLLPGDKFRLVIASTLYEDGTLDDGEYNPTDDRPSRYGVWLRATRGSMRGQKAKHRGAVSCRLLKERSAGGTPSFESSLSSRRPVAGQTSSST